MDELVKQSIRRIEQHARAVTPWKPDEVVKQKFYGFNRNDWAPIPSPSPPGTEQSFTSVALYSWNIDFMLPFADSRMGQAVRHLENLIAKQPATVATMIYLQESLQSDLAFLAADRWVREQFLLTDIDTSNWSSGYYGTVTLIDRRLRVADCFRVHYSQTSMQRDAFFTDVLLGRDGKQTVRFCNTHLESLAREPPMRPFQVSLAADYMQDRSMYGAVMAGDFNAIQDFDRHLHSDNKLRDAYLEQGGKEDSEEGYTWGQQAATNQRERFGCCRMDKVFFCGGLKLRSFNRFGAGVEVEAEDEKSHIVNLGFDKPWITDHLGVVAVFEVDNDQEN